MAAADLIGSRLITLHWESLPLFNELYPTIKTSEEIFVMDSGLMTCSGGAAAMDMMLYVIAIELGKKIALDVSQQLIVNGMRFQESQQRTFRSAGVNVLDARLLRVVKKMHEHIETPLKLSTLADVAHISLRQMERLFQSHYSQSPSRYYMQLRLKRARQLLTESSLTVSSVCFACGFNSVAHFSRSYAKVFHINPSQEGNLRCL